MQEEFKKTDFLGGYKESEYLEDIEIMRVKKLEEN